MGCFVSGLTGAGSGNFNICLAGNVSNFYFVFAEDFVSRKRLGDTFSRIQSASRLAQRHPPTSLPKKITENLEYSRRAAAAPLLGDFFICSAFSRFSNSIFIKRTITFFQKID